MPPPGPDGGASRTVGGSTLPSNPRPQQVFMKTSGGSEGLYICFSSGTWVLLDAAAGDGTVTSVSVNSANGFAGTVADPTTTPAITLTTTITGIPVGNGTAFSTSNVTNDVQTKAAIVPNTAPTSGQILAGNAGGTAYAPVSVSGDATLASTGALTLASVVSAGGPIGSATVAPIITYDAKGRLTTVSSATITPAESSVTFTDITTNNASTTKHGFLPKLDNTVTHFLNGQGGWTTPAGITNAAGANVIPKSDGTNLVASTLTDNGTNILSTEPIAVGFGATTPPSGPMVMVASTVSTSPRGILSAQFSTDTSGARVGFQKARGTVAGPTTVVTGDTLGRLMFRGYDGTNYLEMGSIEVASTGTIGTNRVPTQMVFSTATDAATSVLTAALTIGADQSASFASTVGISGAINGPGSTSVTATGNVRLKGRGYIIPSSDGVWGFYDEATTSFGRIQLGGTTSSYPSLKRSSTTLAVRLADDSADAPISASNVTASGTLAVTGASTLTGETTFGAGGITADGAGFKHARVTTGSVSAGSTALVTITWGTAFADANYTVEASVADSTTSSLSLSVVHIESISASAVTVRVLNNAIGALTGTVHVIAVHD